MKTIKCKLCNEIFGIDMYYENNKVTCKHCIRTKAKDAWIQRRDSYKGEKKGREYNRIWQQEWIELRSNLMRQNTAMLHI